MDKLCELQKYGWYILDNGLKKAGVEQDTTSKDIHKALLDVDIKDFGKPHIDQHWMKKDTFSTDGVLQIQRIRNVAAPKMNEDSETASRLYKLSLTDGHTTAVALEWSEWRGVGPRTAPGTKLRVTAPVQVYCGFVLLPNSALQLLGGHVAHMVDKWLMAKTFGALQSRPLASSAGGPPAWVPFGKRIPTVQNSAENFKSLPGATDSAATDSATETEFDVQRRAQIAEAAQGVAPGGASAPVGEQKRFQGSGVRQMADSNVRTLMSAGFSQRDSEEALRLAHNDVGRALRSLRYRQNAGDQATGDVSVGSREGYTSGRRGRGRGAGRGRGRGRRRDYDDDDGEPAARPTEALTLMDFVDLKISGKGDANSRNVDTTVGVENRTFSNHDISPSHFDSPRNTHRFDRHESSTNDPRDRNAGGGGGRPRSDQRGSRDDHSRRGAYSGSGEEPGHRRGRGVVNSDRGSGRRGGGHAEDDDGYVYGSRARVTAQRRENGGRGGSGYPREHREVFRLQGNGGDGSSDYSLRRGQDRQMFPPLTGSSGAEDSSNRHRFREGDMCLSASATYDDQMCLSRVISAGESTCVVQLVDYADHYEEVHVQNMQPLGQDSQSHSHSAPSIDRSQRPLSHGLPLSSDRSQRPLSRGRFNGRRPAGNPTRHRPYSGRNDPSDDEHIPGSTSGSFVFRRGGGGRRVSGTRRHAAGRNR